MMFLNYDEQALIKMYHFSSKEELKKKLKESLSNIDDEYMKEVVQNLIHKIDNYTIDELNNVDNIFE